MYGQDRSVVELDFEVVVPFENSRERKAVRAGRLEGDSVLARSPLTVFIPVVAAELPVGVLGPFEEVDPLVGLGLIGHAGGGEKNRERNQNGASRREQPVEMHCP